MRIKFDEKINKIIKNLALEAKNFGVKIYFVGGLVRDVLMGIKPCDIDILVEGSAIDFIKSLDFVQIKSQHNDFGTIKTQIEGTDIDFASTRVETYPFPGCLPQVQKIGCNIENDLIRRDFTINSIALEITPDLDFKIIDPFFGLKDIKKRTLKVLHDKSYIDDPTRILRGLDFKLRFSGFDFSKNDKKLIENCLKFPDREHLSKDRVILTLNKLFCNKTSAMAAFCEFVDKKYYKILFDDFPASKSNIEKALWAFACENPAQIFVKYILAIGQNPSGAAIKAQMTNSRLEIYKHFKNMTQEEICLYYALTLDEKALLYQSELKDIKLNITGKDLLALGFMSGRIIGEILDRVLCEKLAKNSTISTLEDEIDYVRKTFIP